MSKKGKIILFSVIGVLLLLIVFFPKLKTLFANEKSPAIVAAPSANPRGQALSVNAVIIRPQTMSDLFRSIGILLPEEEVTLSFETSGKITEILFEEGSYVHKNQLLARVNDKPLQAELKKLDAQLPLANDRVHRQKSLLEKDAVSVEAYEQVNTELEKLQADIELVKARLAQTELRAPFDGMLGLRQISEGAYASPQSYITTLTKISPLKLEFSVNEKQAAEIRKGTKVNFTIDNDAKTYTAEIYALESKLDGNTLTLKARARYPNADGKLRPGRSASVNILLNEDENAIFVPSIAVVAEMGRDIAYIYRNGTAKQTVIKKGMRSASQIQALDGLQMGDTLLVTGVMQLRDEMKVKIEKITN